MISEMENIQKGIVVATVEDSVNKRIIGIGSTTVTPDPVTGIAPLSKQNAFTKEQVESVQQAAEKVLGFEPGVAAVPAIEPTPVQDETQTIITPSVAPIEQPIHEVPNPLPEPKVNGLLTEEPMKVEIPAELSSIPSSAPIIEPLKEAIAPIAEPTATIVNQEMKEPVPAFEPVSEPQTTGEVLATEPIGVNENMFATAEKSPIESTQQSQKQEIVQPLPFESQQSQSQSLPAQTMTDEKNIGSQEPVLNQTQMEQIAKKISDLVYREVLELLTEMSKKQSQNAEEKMDSTDSLVNPILQTPTGYEEKPMTMSL